MRHDPTKASPRGGADPRAEARRPRRPATRRPNPLHLGIAVAATEHEGERLAAEVLDPARRVPLVCLSTRPGEDRPAFDHHRVRQAVGRDAEIRAVRTGPATRYLSQLLPPQLGVFGGAARIWWPGVDEDADPRDHPLVLDRMGRYGPRALEVLAERFAEGPPRRGGRAGARLVALPGGRPADAAGDARVDGPAPPSRRPGGDPELLRALDGARDEIRGLREKLAEARLDALAPEARAAAHRAAARVPGVREGMAPPQPPRPAQLGDLTVPAAVLRDRVRGHQLEIYAAWLARDHDAGRRDRPLGPFALGEDYLRAVDLHRAAVSPAALAVVAARIASGKPGEADDLDVGAVLDAAGDQVHRDEDGAACWSCAVPATDGLRLRWWTRDDGVVELRDVVGPQDDPV